MSDAFDERTDARDPAVNALIEEAARLLASERNVSPSTARRLIRDQGFQSGRFIGAVARDITGGLRITDDKSP